jgi:hypothetical protein
VLAASGPEYDNFEYNPSTNVKHLMSTISMIPSWVITSKLINFGTCLVRSKRICGLTFSPLQSDIILEILALVVAGKFFCHKYTGFLHSTQDYHAHGNFWSQANEAPRMFLELVRSLGSRSKQYIYIYIYLEYKIPLGHNRFLQLLTSSRNRNL